MASNNTIALGFKLSGENDMKRALSDINNALKISASEMALATAQYSENEKSVESLTSKSKILESTITEQNSKIEILQSAMQNAAAAHDAVGQRIEELKSKLEEARARMAEMGSSSNVTKEQLKDQALTIQGLEKELGQAEKSYATTGKSATNYGTQLNNAKARLIDMNKQLEENKKALDKAETGNKSVADAVNGLADAAGINVPPALQGMVSKLDNVNASAATLLGVLGGIVWALGKLSFNTAATADDINTLASISGMSTDTIQEFNYAADLLDVTTETINGSITKMIRSMESSKTKTSDQAKAFRELGISVVDSHGHLADANKTFMKTIDALGKVKNESDRDALSMTIFGKSARELNPLIEIGSKGMKAYADEAHNVGYVMDQETLDSFNELNDAHDRANKQWDAAKIKLAEVLLPALTDLLEAINAIPTSTLTTIAAIAGAIATFGLLAGSVLPIIANLKILSTTAKVSAAITGSAVAAGAGTASAGLAAMLPEIALVVAAMAGAGLAIYEVSTHWGEITDGLSEALDFAQDKFQGFDNWIGRTFSTDFSSKLGALGEMLDGFSADAGNTWQGLKDLMAGTGQFLKGTVTGDWTEALNGITRILRGFGETAAVLALVPVNAVIGIANGILDLFNGIAQLMNKIKITLPQFMGGSTYGVSIPMAQKIPYISLPRYATGTDYHPGGRAIVGERGPEVVDLPAGSRVYPNGVVPSVGDAYTFAPGSIVIEARTIKEFNDIIRYAKQQGQLIVKMGG